MRMLGLAALALLSGCASQPRTAAPSAPATPVAAAPAPASQVAMNDAEDREFVPPPGYTEKLENGQRYYCTKIVVLGSRFPKQDCRTETELRYMESQKGAMRGMMGQRQGVCGSASGCGSP